MMTESGAALEDGVVLTGATGYLGAYLLHALLQQRGARVGCIVRGADEAAAKSALLRRMAWYFPEQDWASHADRITVWPGDLAAKQLGLAPRARAEIVERYRIILNSGALVSHVGLASQFARVNCEAVASLLELARQGAATEFHQVSTLSVRGRARPQPDVARFTEAQLQLGQQFGNAYAESKFRAELLLRRAFAEGQRGSVYRIGFVGPHSVSGRFQYNIEQNNTARYIWACTKLGFAAYRPTTQLRLTPVDIAARAIVALLTQQRAHDQTYHIETDRVISHYDVMRVLQAAGYPLRLLTPADLRERAPKLCRDEELLSIIAAAQPVEDAPELPIDCSWTQAELERLGVGYPEASSRWLGRFIQHAIEVGFLEAPRFWNLAPVVEDLL